MKEYLRYPYEISLWEDRLTAVDINNNEYDKVVPEGVKIVNQYYKENKLCVIGSNTMESEFRVIEPKLHQKTDGTSTLTFSIYTKVYNNSTKEFERNPFIKYLTNERKVKLKYFPNGEMRWLDFVIKKIDESSENYKFTYTATDLFINELSKTGYNLSFDSELENNQGTIQELANKVLENTEWQVGEDSETIQQLNDEPLYKITLNSNLEAYDIFTEEKTTIEAGKTIYAFYNSVNGSDPKYYQFIYNKDNMYKCDDNGVVYDVGNYYCDQEQLDGIPEFYNGFRGERYIRTQKSVYDKNLDKFVKVYTKDGKEYYGYSQSTYFSPSLATNYITNGSDFTSSSGWTQERPANVKPVMDPPASEETSSRIFGLEYLWGEDNTFLVNSGFRDSAEIIKEISLNQRFVFSIKFKTDLSIGDKINFRVARYRKDKNQKYIIGEEVFYFENMDYIFANNTYYFKDIAPLKSLSYKELTDITKDQFGIFIGISAPDNNKQQKINYLIEKVEFFQQFDYTNNGAYKNGIILPSGYVLYDQSKTLKPKYVISTEIVKSYVTNFQYFYDSLQDNSNETLYDFIGEEKDATAYEPVYIDNFEKIRSISTKESNRFNLLQTLSETFECWCRFDIWHDKNGRILMGKDLYGLINSGDSDYEKEKIVFLGNRGYTLEDIYQYYFDGGTAQFLDYEYKQLKFVTFHKRIGQEKKIGFRYGINLKSISRSLDSNDIATKLIVKSNANEFAENGSCNIALAKENKTGENFVYDFSYYINQGFLNQSNLNNDLYYYNPDDINPKGWIGLCPQLKGLNQLRDELIDQQAVLVSQYSIYKSDYENCKINWNASQEELAELEIEYRANFDWIGPIDPSQNWASEELDGHVGEWWLDTFENTRKKYTEEYNWEKLETLPDAVEATIQNIRLLKQTLDTLESNYKVAERQLEQVEFDLNIILRRLQKIEKQTQALISEFELKYIRFIQEASWNSEDYVDHNLYYLDAETTLHKSAFPKISYTFNVVDLSQLEEYKDYSFDLGDITYIEDTEFFGWTEKNGIKIPHKEEIVITEQTVYFESPEKNTFKVQNYRTAFENLFQRLAASTQQLHFYTGEYQRAARVVDTQGNILPACLNEAFSNNNFLLSNVQNQTVKWDEYGITSTNTSAPNEIVRITSGGVFLSNTSGQTWTTGITATGINAKSITTGSLNTGLVNICNGAQKSFIWDSQGINAFSTEEGRYKADKFVRFNQFGIFGVDFQGSSDTDLSDIENIKKNASFYLGYDGLIANSGKFGEWIIEPGAGFYADTEDEEDDKIIHTVFLQPYRNWPKHEEDTWIFSIQDWNKNTNIATSVFRIEADGDLFTSGDIQIGDKTILWADGDASFADGTVYINQEGNIWVRKDGVLTTYIGNDGSAAFASGAFSISNDGTTTFGDGAFEISETGYLTTSNAIRLTEKNLILGKSGNANTTLYQNGRINVKNILNIWSSGNLDTMAAIRVRSSHDTSTATDYAYIAKDGAAMFAQNKVKFWLSGLAEFAGGECTIQSDGTVKVKGVALTSSEKIKKNFQKVENLEAKEILQKGEIWNYNLLHEDDTAKKHYGFVIGKGYNTPSELIINNTYFEEDQDGAYVEQETEGIDIYSMCSILWLCVKDLVKEVEELKSINSQGGKGE